MNAHKRSWPEPWTSHAAASENGSYCIVPDVPGTDLETFTFCLLDQPCKACGGVPGILKQPGSLGR